MLYHNNSHKLFKDTVHGYIPVPKAYCSKIIDSPIFQRLRRIEQTSMRSLYPCAHHDRFIHSLGTYYLGSVAISHLEKNSSSEIKEIDDKKKWLKLKNTFLVACLLHDCGHSPFSHTFEKYYDRPAELDEILTELIGEDDPNFKIEIEDNSSAPHERVSSIVLLRHFKEAILSEEINADPVLAVRMIIGCFYTENNDNSAYTQIANCLISLLNGHAIDVDRLDYISRDKWASGYNSSSVDMSRLLSSIMIKKHDVNGYYVICFHKSALSELESVFEAKNFQNIWIFSHHKVVYDQYLLEKAVQRIAEIITGKSSEIALNTLFDVKSFSEPLRLGGEVIFRPTDDDLMYFMKKYHDSANMSKVNEWLHRQHNLKPVWKTYSEFFANFSNIPEQYLSEGKALYIKAEKEVRKFLADNNEPDDNYFIKEMKPKISSIKKNNIFIFINNKLMCYTELGLPDRSNNEFNNYFLLYIPSNLIEKKGDLLKKIALRCQYK